MNGKVTRWPDDSVGADQLHEMLGYLTRDPEVIGENGSLQIRRLEHAVDQARERGQIKRRRAVSAGRVVGNGYRRSDVQPVVKLPRERY